MLNTAPRHYTLWDALVLWLYNHLHARPERHPVQPAARRSNGLVLQEAAVYAGVPRRFPISPERAATLYRAADE